MYTLTTLSFEFKNLAEKAVKEELNSKPSETLKHYYQACFKQAEIDGVPKYEISQVVRLKLNEIKFHHMRQKDPQILQTQCLINESWYFECAKEAGVTNPEMARNIKDDPETDQKNSSLNSKQNSTYYKENKHLIESIDNFISNTKILRDYAAKNSFMASVSADITADILTRLDAFTKNFSDYFNNKKTVPEKTQFIFLRLYNACSDINNLFGLFFDEIKRIHVENRKHTKKTNQILTTKEMKKFTSRELITLDRSIEFATANEARLHGFYGQQCPICNGFRTKLSPVNSKVVMCVKCYNLKGTDAFPREYFVTCQRCRFIVDQEDIKKKCPHCFYEMVIPSEMRTKRLKK